MEVFRKIERGEGKGGRGEGHRELEAEAEEGRTRHRGCPGQPAKFGM